MRTLLTLILTIVLLVTGMRLLGRFFWRWLARQARENKMTDSTMSPSEPPVENIPPGEIEDAEFKDLD
jgi:hypothetical protein